MFEKVLLQNKKPGTYLRIFLMADLYDNPRFSSAKNRGVDSELALWLVCSEVLA